MRILVSSRGSSGHLTPLAPFAHAAIRSGHQVLVVVQHDNRGNAERLGLPVVTVDAAPRHEWMPLMAGFAELDLETSNATMVSEYFGRLDTRAALPGLRRIAQHWRPDLIVRESWEFASVLVGELLGVPVTRVGLGMGSVEAATDALVPPVLDELRAELGLRPDPAGRALRSGPRLTMVPATVDDVPAAGGVHRFRHAAPAGPSEDEATPLVYVTFGSVAAAPHLPYFPGLYRRAIEALAPLRARVLVTLGDARDAAELGPLPANVRVAPWIPQDEVLSQATAVVHHGGYGTTLGALAHGVPSVVVPLFSLDQWANAAAVDHAGAGIALDEDRATRRVLALPGEWVLDGLLPAVEQVLFDPAYATRARTVAREMAALPAPEIEEPESFAMAA